MGRIFKIGEDVFMERRIVPDVPDVPEPVDPASV